MASILSTDGTMAPFHGELTLEPLQAVVGGLIDVVVLSDGRGLVINDEGKLLGLALNPEATRLAQDVLFAHDVIVGPAVLVSEAELADL